MGQEFILTSEDVLHIGRHMTPILGPEKTGKRWQLLWRLVQQVGIIEGLWKEKSILQEEWAASAKSHSEREYGILKELEGT